jgi:hypothetical protein
VGSTVGNGSSSEVIDLAKIEFEVPDNVMRFLNALCNFTGEDPKAIIEREIKVLDHNIRELEPHPILFEHRRMKPVGKHPTWLPQKPTAIEIIESLIVDGVLMHVKRHGKRYFQFQNRRRLYSPDELLRLIQRR